MIPTPSSPLKTDLKALAIPDVNNQTAYSPACENLLRKPLDWDLKDGEPAILIIHTHATESYTPIAGESYEESGAWRSLDEDYNMISIGDELARLLEETGIRVIHDRTFHDHPSYNSSYSNARRSIDSYLQQYPSIRMVLDIHRDAAQTSYGQLVTSATVGGQRSAQLMMVVGTDASGNYHPEWEENLALALKLSAVLEQTDPGITRPVNIRKERFNMDKTAGSLLIEVGAAGNTHQEAMIAVHALARGITVLAQGAQ